MIGPSDRVPWCGMGAGESLRGESAVWTLGCATLLSRSTAASEASLPSFISDEGWASDPSLTESTASLEGQVSLTTLFCSNSGASMWLSHQYNHYVPDRRRWCFGVWCVVASSCVVVVPSLCCHCVVVCVVVRL